MLTRILVVNLLYMPHIPPLKNNFIHKCYIFLLKSDVLVFFMYIMSKLYISANIQGEKKCLSVYVSASGDHRPVPWCFEV